MILPDHFQRPRLQNLFLVVVILKVGCSILAWKLSSPWVIGFWLPLALMLLYIVAGFLRDSNDISDERFGDSCYYLGFIFTISSIAISLLDVPLLDEQGKMKDIAVRFGAAMVSTFLGFIVRAYVAGFKTDAEDAIRSVEDRLIAAAEDFRVRLELTAERFQLLDQQIDHSTRGVMSRLELAIEGAGKASSEGYRSAMTEMAAASKGITETAAAELATASTRSATSLQLAAASIERMIARSDEAVAGFTDKLEGRLEAARFPQEMLDAALNEPLNEIKLFLTRYSKSLDKLEHAVDAGAAGVETAMGRLGQALTPDGRLGEALTQHYDALGNLIGLAEGTQRLLSDQSNASLQALERVSSSLASIRQTMTEDRSDGRLDDLGKRVSEISEKQSAVIDQQRKLLETAGEIAQRGRALVEEMKGLTAIARSSEKAPEASAFSRWFGRG